MLPKFSFSYEKFQVSCGYGWNKKECAESADYGGQQWFNEICYCMWPI